MRERRFWQVDVFTTRPYFGNPVAVVIDADGLSSEAMQRIARWTNLSETTFVLPPTTKEADYRLRIFTPASELPFAGHPTIGSAHAVLEANVVPIDARTLVQECGAGLLRLDVAGSGTTRRIAVTAPAPVVSAVSEQATRRLIDALGATPIAAPTVVTIGPKWLIAPLDAATTVATLAPDMSALAAFARAERITGVTVFGRYPASSEVAINVRSFAPSEGVPEDPVCGSGNAAVGAYVRAHAQFTDLHGGYGASQGREIGRDGRVEVSFAGDRVRIGGPSVTCVAGVLYA